MIFTCSVRLGAPSLGLVAEDACVGLAERELLDAVIAPSFGRLRGSGGIVRKMRVPIRTFPLIGRTRRGRAYQLLLRDATFDIAAAALSRGSSALMSISGMCNWSLRMAQRRNQCTWLMCPTTHVDRQLALLAEARSALRLPWHPSELNRLTMARARREYHWADTLIVASQLSKLSFVERGVSADRLEVVPHGVDTERFQPTEPPEDSKLRILFVGQIGVRKGVDTLLRACSHLDPASFSLSLVGDLEPEATAVFARQPTVRFRRLPFTAEVPRLIEQSHVVVLPSVEDGFGLVALEAMACARPVVVSDACGAKEVVSLGGGVVFPAGEAEALAAALHRFGTSPAEIRATGLAGRRTAEQFPTSRWQEAIGKVVSARL